MITVTIRETTIHMFVGSMMAPVCAGVACRYCKWQREREATP